MKLKSLIKESQNLDYRRMNIGEKENEKGMTNEEKRAFLEAVASYHQFGEMISHKGNLSEIHENIKNIVENASSLTIKETGDWFDRVTVQRHMKSMNESYKVFSNSINEVVQLQQRLESAYDEIGEVLGKYYEIKEGNEFGAERAKAIAGNEDSFEVDGKSYKVTGVDAEDKENAKKFANESMKLTSLLKREELKGDQHKLDVDGDGEIEASDLAALRAKKDESVNEGIGTIALGVAGGLLLLKVLKFVLKKVVGAIGMNAPLPKEKLLQVVQTMVKTVIAQSSGKQIDMLQLVALQSFLKDEINAGKITTVKQIMQVIDKASKIQPKQESVNEEEIKWNAVENAIINFLKMNTKILDKRVQAKDTDGVKGGLSSIIRGLTNAQRNLKLESVNEAVKPSQVRSVISKVKKDLMKKWKQKGGYENFGDKEGRVLRDKFNFNPYGSSEEREVAQMIQGFEDWAMNYDGNMREDESVNEEIEVGKMVKVVDNPHWEAALGKKGPFKRKVKMIDGENVFFTDGSNSSMKYVKESVSSLNEEKYTIIDPMGNQLGAGERTQVMLAAKKKGGVQSGYFVVSVKNALKAKRALEKFKGDFKNPKLKDMMSNLFYESVNESHFKVGDKVEMSHGGVGVVKSLDKADGADDEKYYNIELPNGDVMKHAPNELKLVESQTKKASMLLKTLMGK
jgi:hypothetical protein